MQHIHIEVLIYEIKSEDSRMTKLHIAMLFYLCVACSHGVVSMLAQYLHTVAQMLYVVVSIMLLKESFDLTDKETK